MICYNTTATKIINKKNMPKSLYQKFREQSKKEHIKIIQEALKGELPYRDIAEKFGRSTSGIKIILHRNGVRVPLTPRSGKYLKWVDRISKSASKRGKNKIKKGRKNV